MKQVIPTFCSVVHEEAYLTTWHQWECASPGANPGSSHPHVSCLEILLFFCALVDGVFLA